MIFFNFCVQSIVDEVCIVVLGCATETFHRRQAEDEKAENWRGRPSYYSISGNLDSHHYRLEKQHLCRLDSPGLHCGPK